jgi:hypothetical protein
MTTNLVTSVAAFAPTSTLSQPFLAGLEQGALGAPTLGTEAPEIQALAVRALKGEIAEGVVADRVWRRLAMRFGDSVPGCEMRLAGDTVEFHVDSQEFAVFDPIDIPYILTWIDEACDGSLNLIERHGNDLILRLPPLSLFEAGARRAFGMDAANWFYVSGELDRGLTNRGHAQRRQQIALPLNRIFLEQAGCEVDEFVYAIHDLNHAVDVAGIHPEMLLIATTLHDTVSSLPQEFQDMEFVQDQLHDLSELLRVKDLTLPNFLKRVFLPWEQELRQLHLRLVPQTERGRILDVGRRYLDLVFPRWLALLSEDRRSSIVSYRGTLETLLR